MANGKVDRRALPAASTARLKLDTSFIAPGTPLEVELARSGLKFCHWIRSEFMTTSLSWAAISLTASQVISRVINRLQHYKVLLNHEEQYSI